MSIYITNTKLSGTATTSTTYSGGNGAATFEVVKDGITNTLESGEIIRVGDFVCRINQIVDLGSHWELRAHYDDEIYVVPTTGQTLSLYFFINGFNIGEAMSRTREVSTGYYGDAHLRYHTIVDYLLTVPTSRINVRANGLFDLLIDPELILYDTCEDLSGGGHYPYLVVCTNKQFNTFRDTGRFNLEFRVGNQNRYRL